jgi:hypothetical protein
MVIAFQQQVFATTLDTLRKQSLLGLGLWPYDCTIMAYDDG